MSIRTGMRKDKNGTATALFGVAAIQILIGAIGYYLSSGEMGLLDRIISLTSSSGHRSSSLRGLSRVAGVTKH